MLPVGLEQSEVRSVLVWSAQQVDVKMFTVDSVATLEIFAHCIKDSEVHSADMLALKAFAYILARACLKVARALAFGAAWQLRCVASDLLNP